jgi:hypothetical protein
MREKKGGYLFTASFKIKAAKKNHKIGTKEHRVWKD